MTAHTIVYLDQNYLSNMAKARRGLPMDKVDSEFWKSLFVDLRAAVLADKIACPESQFQRTEARLDKRIQAAVLGIIDELSWGLEFNRWEVILRIQIEDAAFRFLGKNPPPREAWSTAFTSDPQAPIESRMEYILAIYGGMGVSSSPRDEILEEDRQSKLEFMGEAQEILNRYGNNPPSWSELLLQNKKGVLDGFVGKIARDSILQQMRKDSLWDKLSALDRYNDLVDLSDRLREIGINMDRSEVMKFMGSEQLYDIPFVDINGSIWAAIAQYGCQGRKGEKGDFYDAPILATVLPYCDVITTDGFMKEIVIKKLHFDQKYECKVLSAGKTDRQAFQKLIRGLK